MRGRKNNNIAIELTDPDSEYLDYTHENMELAKSERRQSLLDVPNAVDKRFKGVVVSVSKGIITPDLIGFDDVTFELNELQTTGVEKIDKNSQVEFSVEPCFNDETNENETNETKETDTRRKARAVWVSIVFPEINTKLTFDLFLCWFFLFLVFFVFFFWSFVLQDNSSRWRIDYI